jgi:hypothetical protein
LIIATFQQKSGYHLITRQAGKQKLVPSTNLTLHLIYIPTTYQSCLFNARNFCTLTQKTKGGLISETFSVWLKSPNIGTKS